MSTVVQIILIALGIVILLRVLFCYFDRRAAIITVLLIPAGTNFLQILLVSESHAHAILFILYLTIIWLSFLWQKGRHWGYLLPMLPVVLGISFLNPPGIFILLFPLLADVGERDFLRKSIIPQIDQYVFLILILILCLDLQNYSWFIQPGKDLFYGMAGKSAFPVNPANIHRVLFSANNGLFRYAPILIIAFAGFWYLAEKSRALFLSSFLFFIICLVYVSSDPVWRFAGRFGYPNLVETYAVLALPLASLVEGMFSRKKISRALMIVATCLIIVLNCFMMYRFGHSDLASGPERFLPIDSIPPEARNQSKRLLFFDFEGTIPDRDNYRTQRYAHTGKYSFCLDNPPGFSPGLWVPMAELDSVNPSWISVTGYIYFTCISRENDVFLVITGNRQNVAFKYRVTDLSDTRYYPGRWNKVSMSYLLPFPTDPKDVLQVYFWNRGKKQCFIDDVEIRLHTSQEKP